MNLIYSFINIQSFSQNTSPSAIFSFFTAAAEAPKILVYNTVLSFPDIDISCTFLTKTAVEWAHPNVRATSWNGWESLESYISQEGRTKCLAMLSAKA